MRTLIPRFVCHIGGLLFLCLAVGPMLAADTAARSQRVPKNRYDLRFVGMDDQGQFALYEGSTVVKGVLTHDWGSLSIGYLFRSSDDSYAPAGRLVLAPTGRSSIQPLPADIAERNGVSAESGTYWIEFTATDATAQGRLLKRLGLPSRNPSTSDNRTCESARPVTVKLSNYMRYAVAGDASYDLADLVEIVSIDGPPTLTSCAALGLHPAPVEVRGVLVFDLADKLTSPQMAKGSHRVYPRLETARPLLDAPASAAGQRYRVFLDMDHGQQLDALKRLGVPDPLPDGQSRRACGFRLPVTVRLREYRQDEMQDTPVVEGWAVMEKMTFDAGSVLQRPCKASELRMLEVPEIVIAGLKLPEDAAIDATVARQMQDLLGK